MALRITKYVLCALLLVCSLLYVINRSYNVFDDSYITYRYAMNLYNGHGLSWNIGEKPTEGCSSPLYALLMVPSFFFNIEPMPYSVTFSVILSFLSAFLIFKIASINQESRNFAYLFPLAYIFNPITLNNITLGMESVLVAFLTCLIFYRIKIIKNLPDLYLACFIGLVGFLTRMDFMVILAGLLPFVLYKSSKAAIPKKQIFFALLSVSSLIAIYNLWRFQYFGDIFPNPYYIKFVDKKKLPGLSYTANFITDAGKYLLALLVAAFSIGFLSRIKKQSKSFAYNISVETVFCAAPLLLFMGYVLTIKPLMGSHHRFLYPVFPLIFIAASYIKCRSEDLKMEHVVTVIFLLFLFVNMPDYKKIYSNIKDREFPYTKHLREHPGKNLMYKEYEVAKTLSGFNGISQKLISFGDAGVVGQR